MLICGSSELTRLLYTQTSKPYRQGHKEKIKASPRRTQRNTFRKQTRGKRIFLFRDVFLCVLSVLSVLRVLCGEALYGHPAWMGLVTLCEPALPPQPGMKHDCTPARPPAARTSRSCRSEERRVGKECRSRWSPDH